MSFMNRYNFPSIVCLHTIIWDVKCYTVRTKGNWRSYVIFLLILPLRHLKYKNMTSTLKQIAISVHLLLGTSPGP